MRENKEDSIVADENQSSKPWKEAPPISWELELGDTLKYYLYMSKTKIEMLHPQIPVDFLKGASADVKINLGIVSSTIKASHVDSAVELPNKLVEVCEYLISKGKVGTVDKPKSYIVGILPLRFGIVREYASDIAFFGNVIENQKVGLIGATSSLVGESESTEVNHAPYYYTLKFLNQIADVGDETNESPGYHTYHSAFDLALKTVPKNKQQLEFVAKVIHVEKGLVLATPLYVALTE